LLTKESGSAYGGPKRVLVANTLITTSLAMIIGGLMIAFVPWLLLGAYGRSFVAAEVPIIILVATGIIHMSSAPAAHRLSITGLRAIGVINTIWAILIIVLGLWLVPKKGATGAAMAFMIAHVSSYVLVIWSLARSRELPEGWLLIALTGLGGALALAGIGYWRALAPSHFLTATIALLAVMALFLIGLRQVATRMGYLPTTLGTTFQIRKARMTT